MSWIRVTTVTIVELLSDDYMDNNFDDNTTEKEAAAIEVDAVEADSTLITDLLNESDFTVAITFKKTGE